ncbi:MAG: hypothetical protein H0T69_08720 [Thermoleophilaceae bacterium]|nr:hypothetical protein [Thermoleophilaceae bacterium]
MALALLVVAVPAGAQDTIKGTLTGAVADDLDNGRSVTNWTLDTGTRTVKVLPTTLPALVPENANVTVAAEQAGGTVVGPVTAASPQAAPALGGRTTAVIVFNFATDLRQPWTIPEVKSNIFTAPGSTSAFFAEESYNQLWLTGQTDVDGDVYGWYTLPTSPTSCDFSSWASLAKTAAAADGFDAAGYRHVMYVFPAQSVCKWAGLAYMPGTESWINGEPTVRVTGHELGHNLGLHHAGAWFCKNAGNQAVTISSSCVLNEYNDPFDVMGSWGSRHSHGWQLQRLGVLQPSNVRTVTTSDTYSMTSALDSTSEPTTLRVPRTYAAGGEVQDWYYLEVREAGGVFENFSPTDAFATGVSIRVDDDPSQTTRSRLLDTHPGGSIYDAPLRPGETFSDGQISVTTVSAGDGSASVAINMSAPPLDQQPPSAPTRLSHVLLGAGLRLSWYGSGDNVGVSTYSVYRDGVQVGSAASNSYDDTSVLPGQHVYTVYAQDAAGNLSPASAPHVVAVPGPKSVALKSGSTDRSPPRLRLVRHRLRGGRLQFTASASDRAGIAQVALRIDGHQVRARRASRLSYRWRPRSGRHRVVAVAHDRRGNRAVDRLNLRVPRA